MRISSRLYCLPPPAACMEMEALRLAGSPRHEQNFLPLGHFNSKSSLQQLIKAFFPPGKSVIISHFIGEHAQDDPSGRCFIGVQWVQWSGVCILVIAHLWMSSYVRWASNGNIKQPLGVLVAGHFASEKNTTFFVFARTLHAPSVSFFPAQETTIEHLFANDRLSEQVESWVTKI